MSSKDPKGYYKILGIDCSATESDIKSAFKKKAMELHPDRNKAKNATQLFQLLNEALSVLSDPDLRAEYDTSLVETVHHTPEEDEDQPEPAVCSVCDKVSAQPRYSIFYDVRSFLFYTSKRAHQGIYCSVCAEKQILKASLVTWLFGWWGLPWGPIYSIQTLLVNMFGGKRPNDMNARLTFYQAWVFAYNNKLDVAYAVAQDALRFANKLPRRNASQETLTLKNDIDNLINTLTKNGVNTVKLINSWALFNKAFYIQASVMLLVFGVVADALYNESKRNNNNSNGSSYSASEQIAEPIQHKPAYTRPLEDPNGNEWPDFPTYVDGYPQLRTNGKSKVTVDNNRNDSDVFVKLYALQNNGAAPVRVFFIPAHSDFTVENITAGEYDLRYQNLDSGKLSRSESFVAKERQTDEGIEFSVFTMTLYKVANGNMHTYALDEDEF
ncbi:J domain-containing protein [Methylophilus sp. 'Pure River']|uniref:J domain-containing protein n=1 Tax=Methylophilus sp. 'Pure River' TaxID=3377117 RepID=UPI00398F33FF